MFPEQERKAFRTRTVRLMKFNSISWNEFLLFSFQRLCTVSFGIRHLNKPGFDIFHPYLGRFWVMKVSRWNNFTMDKYHLKSTIYILKLLCNQFQFLCEILKCMTTSAGQKYQQRNLTPIRQAGIFVECQLSTCRQMFRLHSEQV